MLYHYIHIKPKILIRPCVYEIQLHKPWPRTNTDQIILPNKLDGPSFFESYCTKETSHISHKSVLFFFYKSHINLSLSPSLKFLSHLSRVCFLRSTFPINPIANHVLSYSRSYIIISPQYLPVVNL